MSELKTSNLSLQPRKFKLNLTMPNLGNELIDILDFMLDFTLEETDSILALSGSIIQKLQYSAFVDDEIDKYAKLFAAHCENLEDIKMEGLEVTGENVPGQLLAASKHLKRLRLHDCIISDNVLHLIPLLTNLETLDLEGSKIFGKLKIPEQLIELNLLNCCVQTRYFLDKRSQLNDLKTLNISMNIYIPFKALGKLETLVVEMKSMTIKYPADEIRVLKSLREIKIRKINYFEEVKNLITSKKRRCFIKNTIKVLECLMYYHGNRLQSIELSLELFFKSTIPKDASKIFRNLKALTIVRDTCICEQTWIDFFKSLNKLELLELQYFWNREAMYIAEAVGCLRSLRYLDIAESQVKGSISRIVETRRNQGFEKQLIVFIKSKFQLADLSKSGYNNEYQKYVMLVTKPKGHYNISTLERLSLLDAEYPIKTDWMNNKMKGLFPCRTHLLYLNKECLREIIKYLNVMEKFTLVLTSKHFDPLIKDFLSNDLLEMRDLLRNFTSREIRCIFSRCGAWIHRISFSQYITGEITDFHNTAPLITQYCTNLQHIKICSFGECLSFYQDLIASSAKTLKKLSLVLRDPNLNLQIAWILDTTYILNQLHELEIGRIEDIDFDKTLLQTLLEKLENLETLKFSDTTGLRYTNMCALGALKSLTGVQFRYSCDQETIALLRKMTEPLTHQIKFLAVDVIFEETVLQDYLNCISGFSNLKYLELDVGGANSDTLVDTLFESCPRLEVLYTLGLSCTADIKAVQGLRHLRHLVVDYNKSGKTYIDIFRHFWDIKKARNDTMRLTIHSGNFRIFQTREHKALQQFVIFSDLDVEWENRAELMVEKHSPEVNRNIISSAGPFFDFPEKVLRIIASNLSSTDKLAFAFTKKKFLSIIKSFADEIIFDMNEISKIFTVTQAQSLFHNFSGHIHRFKYSREFPDDLIEYLNSIEPYSESFREMENLERGLPFMFDELENESRIFYKLEKLCASPNQKLEKLIIHKIRDKADQSIIMKILDKRRLGIDPFKHLAELSISCENIAFNELLPYCQLKRLKLLNCSRLGKADVKLLLESQDNCLKYLTIDNCNKILSDVARLSNLKHIFISLDMFSHNPGVKDLDLFLNKLLNYRRYDLMSIKIYLQLWYNYNRASFINMEKCFEEKRNKFLNLKAITIEYCDNPVSNIQNMSICL